MRPEATRLATPSGERTVPETERLLRRTRLAGAGAIAAVALTATGLTIAEGIAERRVSESRTIGRVGRQALTLAIDRETGLRGFLLTRDSLLLEPDRIARTALPAKLDTLATLTAVDPARLERVRRIDNALRQWERDVVLPIESGNVFALSPDDARAAGRLGKDRFDTLRAALRELIDSEEDRYRVGQARHSRVRIIGLLLILSELTIIAIGFRERGRRVELQARQAAEMNVSLENQRAELEAQAAELEHGIDESQALTAELEASNEELGEALRRAADAAATARDSENRQLAATEQLRAVLEAAPLAICTMDPDGVVLSWNAAAERMFGWSPAEVVGRPLPIVPADKMEEFATNRAQALTGRSYTGLQTQRVRKDGVVLDVMLSTGPIRDSTGACTSLVALYADVSEQHRVQAELAASEQRYRRLVESAPDAILIHAKGRIVFVNPAGVALFGARSSAELIGRPAIDLVHPDSQGAVARRIDTVEQGVATAVGEQKLVRLDGTTVDVESSAIPHEYEGEAAAQVTIRDLTERKQLAEQLRQSQKMEAVGRLAGGVAHDFNNILTVITTYCEILLAADDLDSGVRGPLVEVLSAAERAARLTRQLLAFSRKQVLHPTVLDLGEVVEGMTGMLGRLIGEDVRIETRLATDRWMVRADRGQVEQVILNLAVNARDAMPRGGRLLLTVTNIADLQGVSGPRWSALGGPHVMLAVSDDGIGMDAATQQQIFEPFYTTKEPGKGTGLGLSTVYGIVKQSGGSIFVYSEPGRGTVFKIYLPRFDGEPDAELPVAPIHRAAPAGVRVLLVEDDDAVRAVIHRLLESLGHEVTDARNATVALDLVHAGTEFTVVVTDGVMPGMSGRDLADRLRVERPHLPIVLMSGFSEDAIRSDGPLGPNVLFVEKPFTADTFARALTHALSRVGGGP